jgi:hypothetical protein
MNNIKCAQCGLVSWSTEVECKRCGSLLTVQDKPAQNPDFGASEPKPLFSGALKVLTVILAFATVAFLFSRVFHLIDRDTGMKLAVIFMLGGMALTLLAHLWLLARIFEQSIAWGFGTLFISLVGLFAVAKFWEKTRRSFVSQMVCLAIAFMGSQDCAHALLGLFRS